MSKNGHFLNTPADDFMAVGGSGTERATGPRKTQGSPTRAKATIPLKLN